MNKQELRIIEDYILRRTVPIISTQTKDGLAEIHGTGFLYEDGDDLFLVTAAHLYEKGIDLTQFATPLGPRSREIWTLGNFVRHAPVNDSSLDMMIFEIQSADVKAKLRKGWEVVAHGCIDAPTTAVAYIVSGFPHALSETSDELLVGTPICIFTGMLPAVPEDAEEPVVPGLDLFFLCDNSAETLYGTPVTIPKLQGISGGPLWQLQEPTPGSVWAPENVLRMVGITTSYRNGKYIRAKSWLLGKNILSIIGQESSAASPP